MTVRRPFALLVAVPLLVAQSAAPDTQFRRDPALMLQRQAALLAQWRARDPRAAAALAPLLRRDVVEPLRPLFRQYGLSAEDAADMSTVYWITAWEGVHGSIGAQTDPAIVRGVQRQLRGKLGALLRGKPDAVKQEIADTMLLQFLFADARLRAAAKRGPADVERVGDAIRREAATLLKVDLGTLDMTAQGFRPHATAATDRPSAAPAPAARARTGGAAAAVAGTYFRPTYGTGGAISYEPLVLFANGDYVELDEEPLADLDPAADRARAPRRWGTWRRQGATFLLTDNKGRTSDYTLGGASFYPAFAGDKGPRPSGTYRSTSGSTMTMGSGTVSTLAINALTFRPDGTFSEGREGGGIAPGAAIGSRRTAGGRWTLDGSALTLDYADGRRVRRSFLWGATGSPPRPDADMAFIGGDTFLRDD